MDSTPVPNLVTNEEIRSEDLYKHLGNKCKNRTWRKRKKNAQNHAP